MLTLYHFILTKECVPLRQEGMRSLRDGKGGWRKGSGSCCAGAEEAPDGTGALELLSPWEPWSLCPSSSCSGGSPQRAVPRTGVPRAAEVRATAREAARTLLAGTREHSAPRQSIVPDGGVGFARATPLQRVWKATEPPHPTQTLTLRSPTLPAVSTLHTKGLATLGREEVQQFTVCAAAHVAQTRYPCSAHSVALPAEKSPSSQTAPVFSLLPPPQNFSQGSRSAESGCYQTNVFVSHVSVFLSCSSQLP